MTDSVRYRPRAGAGGVADGVPAPDPLPIGVAVHPLVHHGRPPAPCRAPAAKNSAVRRRPSSRATTGSHPSSRRATVMSGRRRVGSSVGSGSWTIVDDDPVSAEHGVGQLEHRQLVGVADVHRAR